MVLAEVRRAGEHLAELREGQAGTVTVGTLLAGTSVLLPRAVAALKRERPRITVVVREATFDVLYPQLLAGEVDVVVGRIGPSPEAGRVRSHTLYHEPIRLIARRGHPLADAARDPALADTVGYPWILPLEQTTLRGELAAVFDRHGLPLLDRPGRVHVDSDGACAAPRHRHDRRAAGAGGDRRRPAGAVAGAAGGRAPPGRHHTPRRPHAHARGSAELLRHLEEEGARLRASLTG
ncbi:LysR substrate-binding domain-containing protein [Yinghuangia aomiensis]